MTPPGGATGATDRDARLAPRRIARRQPLRHIRSMTSHRRYGLFLALAAFAALGTAYFAQDVLRMIPCPLCYIERWPWRIAAALGILAAILPRLPARVLIGLAALALFVNVAIAFVHVGAEQHWWKSPLPECNAPPPSFGANLPLRPSASCDAPVFLIPGLPISFATMDLIWSLVVALAASAHIFREKRSNA